MGIDTCKNVVNTDTAFSSSTDVGQNGMLKLSPCVCTVHQGVAPVITKRAAEIFRHAKTKPLDCGADSVGLFSGGDFARQQLPN